MEQLQLSKSNSNASLHEIPIDQNQVQDQGGENYPLQVPYFCP